MAGKVFSAVSKQIMMGNLFGDRPKGMTADHVFCVFCVFRGHLFQQRLPT